MSKPKFKEIARLVSPVILLVLLGSLSQNDSFQFLQKKIDGPTSIVIEAVIIAPVSNKQAVDEIYNPTRQPSGATSLASVSGLPPAVVAQYKGIDHKATVFLNYRGNKPSWWGQDEVLAPVGSGANNGFITSTASTLAWNVNNGLFYQISGKMRSYAPPKGTLGSLISGGPRYDVTLDRYVAMFYLPLSPVPTKQGRIKWDASFWPNRVSPEAKFSILLNKKDKGRRVIKNPS